jgi:hypothetical protein
VGVYEDCMTLAAWLHLVLSGLPSTVGHSPWGVVLLGTWQPTAHLLGTDFTNSYLLLVM